MLWPEGVALIQGALVVALWVSLPVIIAASIGGILSGYAHSALGLGDGASALAPRLAVVVGALVLFGAWMLALTAQYWSQLWAQAAALATGAA